MDSVLENTSLKLIKEVFKEFPILWVLDCNGNIFFAVEEVVDSATKETKCPLPRKLKVPINHEKIGHPSLLDGVKARIGGEILFDEANNQWYIFNKSGRYGKKDSTQNFHLENDARLFKKIRYFIKQVFFSSRG